MILVLQPRNFIAGNMKCSPYLQRLTAQVLYQPTTFIAPGIKRFLLQNNSQGFFFVCIFWRVTFRREYRASWRMHIFSTNSIFCTWSHLYWVKKSSQDLYHIRRVDGKFQQSKAQVPLQTNGIPCIWCPNIWCIKKIPRVDRTQVSLTPTA